MNTVKYFIISLLGIGSSLSLSCSMQQVQVAKQELPPSTTAETATSINKFLKMADKIDMTWPLGTATPSEQCGICHQAIYREYALGFGSDLEFKGIVYKSAQDKILKIPSNVSARGSAHFLAGVDPFPIHARGAEEEGKSCDVCHFPKPFQITDIEKMYATEGIQKPTPRSKDMEDVGLTCASCHLTPEGVIRGPYEVNAPHKTVQVKKMQTADMCAYCHSLGRRVIGKQTQTYLEWREDFNMPGLGRQHCQDCHMPRTLRKAAENFDVPIRAVSRHLWTGGHSTQRLRTALSLVAIQPQQGQSGLEFHVINIGAGHSVPTGSNRRAVFLRGEIIDIKGNILADNEWMFAPWYGDRPDDQAWLEEDEHLPDSEAAIQADFQGPHESPVRAGEERILTWIPRLMKGNYTVRASIIYDLNRYNKRSFTDDQTTIFTTLLSLKVE
ncbi:MAG: hypothetical protein HY607_03285 [Planctomycetes bacterium]|nr:hypothetical protein [Planctomycetota bacterium]